MTDYSKKHLAKPFAQMSEEEKAFLGLTARQEIAKLAQKYKGQEAVLTVIAALLKDDKRQTTDTDGSDSNE